MSAENNCCIATLQLARKEAIESVLDAGVLQDAINEYENDDGQCEVTSAICLTNDPVDESDRLHSALVRIAEGSMPRLAKTHAGHHLSDREQVVAVFQSYAWHVLKGGDPDVKVLR